MDRRLRDLKKIARQFDRQIEHRSRHIALTCPHGRRPVIFFSATPSDRRALLNLISELRRNDQ